jgi:hypothetical protein
MQASIAQISTPAPGRSRRSSSTAASSFFGRGAILFGRRIRMARPRLLDQIADRDQGIPPALVGDGSHPVELRKPARNLGPRPKARHPPVAP